MKLYKSWEVPDDGCEWCKYSDVQKELNRLRNLHEKEIILSDSRLKELQRVQKILRGEKDENF